jgi:hypothetical protein
MSMCITIADIQMKPKRCIVITSAGRRLGCWADKLGKLGLEKGGTYNVETEESQFGDALLTNIVSAKRVTTPVAEQPVHAPSSPAGTPFRTPKQLFAQGVLEAYIHNGRCEPEKLVATLRFICNAFDAVLLETDYAQAAE